MEAISASLLYRRYEFIFLSYIVHVRIKYIHNHSKGFQLSRQVWTFNVGDKMSKCEMVEVVKGIGDIDGFHFVGKYRNAILFVLHFLRN